MNEPNKLKKGLNLAWLRENLPIWLIFFGLLAAYHFIYGQFFPGKNGMMGHDWNLSGLLVDAVKYRDYGLSWWSILTSVIGCSDSARVGPGFPISFSGWLAYMGLTPLSAVYLEFLAYAALGFWGSYLLLKRTFGIDAKIAALGGGLFMFNEFYSTQMIIGHGFQAIMLVPLLAWLLTESHEGNKSRVLANIKNSRHGICAGLVLCLAWLGGMAPIVVAIALSLAVTLLLVVVAGRTSSTTILARGLWALFSALGVSWWSLSQSMFSGALGAAIAQRQSYLLQGFPNIWATLKMQLTMLFYGPADIETTYSASIINLSVYQGRHELEYSIGPAALVLLMFVIVFGLVTWLKSDNFIDWKWWKKNSVWLTVLTVILLFPVLYTTYSPLATPFWKSLPLINATTSPQRLYSIYIVFFSVLIPYLAAKYLPRQAHWFVLAAVMVVGTGFSAFKDRAYYHNQPYNPAPVLNAYQQIINGQPLPPIKAIGLLKDNQGRVVHDQNVEMNLFLQGVEPMGCYVPGYSSIPLELVKQLHPGSVWDVTDGVYNIKNPACNVWPVENKCKPGDHFKVDQRNLMERYLTYKPLDFPVSERQMFADRLSAYVLIFVILVLFGGAGYRFMLVKRDGRIDNK